MYREGRVERILTLEFLVDGLFRILILKLDTQGFCLNKCNVY